MRKIVLLVLIIFSACSEDEICNSNCYEIVTVENRNRICSVSGCRYTYRVIFKDTCSGELQFKTTLPRKLNQKPQTGDLVCGDFLGYN